MHSHRHIFWPLLLAVLLVIMVPAQGQPWGITILNDLPIVAGSEVTFNVTGEPSTPFHVRITRDNASVGRIPTTGTLSLPESGEMDITWISPVSLSSGNYTVEVFLDPQEIIIRVPETVQPGDYLLTAKIQKGFGMTCDTTGDPGWNELFQINWTSTFGTYFFKACQNIADDDDAGTVSGLQGDAVIYGIRGHTLSEASPEFVTSFNAGTIDPNPPAIAPTYPEYLAVTIGVAATDSVGAILSLLSAPYTDVVVDNLRDNQYLTAFSSQTGLTVAVDPSIFDVNCDGICDQIAGWGAATIAIPNGATFEPVLATARLAISAISLVEYQVLVIEQLEQDIEELKIAIEILRAELEQLGLNQTEIDDRLRILELLVEDLQKQITDLERLMGDDRPPVIPPPETGLPLLWFVILTLAFVLSIVGIVMAIVAFKGRD